MTDLTITVDHNITRTSEVVAAEINYIKGEASRTLLIYAIEVGKRLEEAKELVNHGEWGAWLSEKVDYSQSKAEELMKLYREFGEEDLGLFGKTAKSQTYGNLPYSKAVALLALPNEEREEFVKAIDIESATVRELREEIETYKAKLANVEDTKAAEESKEQEAEELTNKLAAAKAEAKRIKSELDKTNQANEKLAKEADKLKKKLDSAQTTLSPEQEKLMEEERLKVQSELETLNKQNTELEEERQALTNKLAAAMDTSLIETNLYFTQLQSDFEKLTTVLSRLKVNDPDKSIKVISVINAKLAEMQGIMEGF